MAFNWKAGFEALVKQAEEYEEKEKQTVPESPPDKQEAVVKSEAAPVTPEAPVIPTMEEINKMIEERSQKIADEAIAKRIEALTPRVGSTAASADNGVKVNADPDEKWMAMSDKELYEVWAGGKSELGKRMTMEKAGV